jgi:hypothetical protein
VADRSPTTEKESRVLEEWLVEGDNDKADAIAILRLTLDRLVGSTEIRGPASDLIPGDIVHNIGTVATAIVVDGGAIEVRYTARPGTPYRYAAGRMLEVTRPV